MSNQNNMQENGEGKKESYREFVIWAIVVFGLWILSWVLIELFIQNDESKGVFGDMFGAINALFSGLAFAGVIFAIVLQRRELSLQRTELQLTRNEFTQQNETLTKQRFENTFFQMLDLHHKLIDRLKYDVTLNENDKNWSFRDKSFLKILIKKAPEPRVYRGREVFDVSKQRLDAIMHKKYMIEKEEGRTPIDREIILDSYRHFYYQDKFGDSVFHYIMTLYRVFKLINETGLSEEEQKVYAGIVRAQLTQEELYLLFYNAIHPQFGNPKFLYLLAKYDIFQHFDWQVVKEYSNHMNLFSTMRKDVLNRYNASNPQKVDVP